MDISAELAELNFDRYQDFHEPFTTADARPALLAFAGDVYQGMDAAATFTERDYTHAQKVLRILSGLYGVLRPLDLMQPYRLEMGSKLATDRGRDLYQYWGERITDVLNADLAASPGPAVVVNLASPRVLPLGGHPAAGRAAGDAGVPGRAGRQGAQDDLVLRQAGPGVDGGLDHPQPGEVGAGAAGLRRAGLTGSTPNARPPIAPCTCAGPTPPKISGRLLGLYDTQLHRDSGLCTRRRSSYARGPPRV